MLKTAKVKVESYWPALFAKLAEKKNLGDLIANAAGGGGAPAAVAAAPVAAAGGGAAAAAPAAEEKKKVTLVKLLMLQFFCDLLIVYGRLICIFYNFVGRT